MIHELKTWPEYYEHLVSGRKTFELRRNDRAYRENDTLHLREYEPVTGIYTGREMHRVVTYMLATDMSGDFVVMALAPLESQLTAIQGERDELKAMLDEVRRAHVGALNVGRSRLESMRRRDETVTLLMGKVQDLEQRAEKAEGERDALREAAQAALLYDAAIHRRGFMGDTQANDGEREHYATGDDLDVLYMDWIAKARAALHTGEER